MYFLIADDELLKKYKDIWNKVSNSMEKKFDSESIYNKMFLKTKIKLYNNDDATVFHDKEMSKVGFNYTYFAVRTIDSVLKDENYYSQAFLKECKYTEKEKKWLDLLLFFLVILMKNTFTFNEHLKGFHTCSVNPFRFV